MAWLTDTPALLLFMLANAGSAYAQTHDEPATEVTVLGSRIPQLSETRSAPITVVDATELAAGAFATTSDALRALTQNSGETQSPQSFSGASFTPGAQQVDLRGFGPNHTLVLVNGRRVADFPLPFQGRSNFTDISNIPLSLIERIEVLDGSASAIYGSDAIAGVVNFVLKERIDETSIDYRYGDTQQGGGSSHRFTFTSGMHDDSLDASFGIELFDQQPLWAFDRTIQDSTADNPTTGNAIARRTFLRTDPQEQTYIDPGAETCRHVSLLNDGSTYYASRAKWGADAGDGRYCGSDRSIGYGTILSDRRSLTAHGSLTYRLSDSHTLFTAIDVGRSGVSIFRDVLDWQYQDSSGSEDGVFYNQSTGRLDNWYRQFAPEEFGGLKRSMISNKERTLRVVPGIRGRMGASGWQYEFSLNHSEYESRVSWPQIVAKRANDLYLGPQLGMDDDTGYARFNADPERLYRPLTRAEYDSIAARSVYKPRSQYDGAAFTANSASLLRLPAGSLGAALIAELDRQSYEINPDPLALTDYYYALRDSDGHGQRQHQGLGVEFRVPVFDTVQLSQADRYDRYAFAHTHTDKFTYEFGLEWRPAESLLLRSSYGTGFRAPDLHYVFVGEGNTHPVATDYYSCRTKEPHVSIAECTFSDVGIVETRIGNRGLDSETSTSLDYGLVWSPVPTLAFSLDYFRIELSNEVQDLDRETLLRTEADCRLGRTQGGVPVDANSQTCVDAFARVRRNSASSAIAPEQLIGVRVNPINIATERTSGIDFSIRATAPCAIGELSLAAGVTYVRDHVLRQYPGDRPLDQFELGNGYDIPRSKATATLTWSRNRWMASLHGERLDRLPNYAETDHVGASYLYSGTLGLDLSRRMRLHFAVDNLLDSRPAKDWTYASYPYYDISWFDAVGRAFYLQVTMILADRRARQ